MTVLAALALLLGFAGLVAFGPWGGFFPVMMAAAVVLLVIGISRGRRVRDSVGDCGGHSGMAYPGGGESMMGSCDPGDGAGSASCGAGGGDSGGGGDGGGGGGD